MDFANVLTKIKELGHANNKREELQDYCSSKIDQIIKLLPRAVLNSDGADLLDCLMKGLVGNTTSLNASKIKIIDIVLTSMRKDSTSLTHCGDVIGRLRLELSRMPVNNLVKWCNNSIQSIVDDSDVNMIWRDILPECMNTITTYDTVRHCDTDMPSEDYKEQCVHTLCQCRWSERQLAQLAAMFKDMHLSKSSHKQVVNKICSFIIDIPPETLPPLLHQLLKLCKTYNLETVLAHLSHYFTLRLYSTLEPPPQDSESTTMDIDDIVPHSPAELSRCLSTCIYHVKQGPVQPDLVKKHIKTWPKTQLLRAPFIIDLALAISDKGKEYSVCLDVIRSAIEQRVIDEQKCKESAWVRSVIPPDVDVASLLKVLTTESANHRQLTVMGLINLAFSLLNTNRSRPSAHACWSHGNLILVRLCKSQPETAGYILSLLADRIAMDCTQRQYADCLHVLCKLTPVSIEKCSQLSTILENCQPIAGEYLSAAAVLEAVRPLLNFSMRTRDVLIMVCRKGLYSRDSLHRCLSVCGLLTVLRDVRISRSLASSQTSSEQYSVHSYLTQIAVDMHATQTGAQVTSRVRNEAVCMEVVSILRRCLGQDSAVKKLLYARLYVSGMEKPSLNEPILELLYEQLVKYLPDQNDIMTILWDKCIQINGAEAVLIEPISRLLYLIAQYLQPLVEDDVEDILSSQTMETASAFLKSKLNNVMEKLCANSIGNIDLECTGLNDLTPESKAMRLKALQLLQCYEALIAFKIMKCTPDSSDIADSVYTLFKSCNQLLELTKNPSKSKKKLNETKDTSKSQKSQKSQKDKPGPVKISILTKERGPGPFKPLPCLWDLKFCVKILELLYSDTVAWCSVEQRNSIRSRRDFHLWVLHSVGSVCELADKRDTPKLITITALLYTRCICRFQTICEFDEQTALGCLELFRRCLCILLSPTFSLKLEGLMPAITNLPEAPPSEHIAAILEHLDTALMQTDLDNELEDCDAMSKKLLASLISVITVLMEIPTHSCSKMCNVIVKFEDYIRTSKQDCISLIPALLSAGCRNQQEAQLLDDILTKITEVLGRNDEEETPAEESTVFPSIDSRSGHSVLNHLCTHINNRLKYTEHLMQRAKDLSGALNITTSSYVQRVEKELKELHKGIVIQLCQLCTWVGKCGSTRFTIGVGSDKVLTTCVRLYAVLASFIKQLDVEAVSGMRLERLLKLSGKKLSLITDSLINYIEESQSQQNASKILKDTKLIPRLVLEAEQYRQNVILLANKADLNWQQYMSLGTARDFRIKANILEEVLNSRERQADDTRSEVDEDDINVAPTEIVSLVGDENRGRGQTTQKRRKIS